MRASLTAQISYPSNRVVEISQGGSENGKIEATPTAMEDPSPISGAARCTAPLGPSLPKPPQLVSSKPNQSEGGQ